MANTLISVRMSDELLQDVDALVKTQGYSNAQEFLRAAAREKIQKDKLALAKIQLEKLYGSAKSKKIKVLTAKDRDRIARLRM